MISFGQDGLGGESDLSEQRLVVDKMGWVVRVS